MDALFYSFISFVILTCTYSDYKRAHACISVNRLLQSNELGENANEENYNYRLCQPFAIHDF